jgi:hypothetical protein
MEKASLNGVILKPQHVRAVPPDGSDIEKWALDRCASRLAARVLAKEWLRLRKANQRFQGRLK